MGAPAYGIAGKTAQRVALAIWRAARWLIGGPRLKPIGLRLWKHSVESLEFSGLEALDRVKASGAVSSALGEGLADALNVGGI